MCVCVGVCVCVCVCVSLCRAAGGAGAKARPNWRKPTDLSVLPEGELKRLMELEAQVEGMVVRQEALGEDRHGSRCVDVDRHTGAGKLEGLAAQRRG